MSFVVLNVVLIVLFKNSYSQKVRYDTSGDVREGDNEINDITYSHEYLNESIEDNRTLTYEYSDEVPSSTVNSVKTTTTIEVATCKYQKNITLEESDESHSTLINFPFSVSVQKKGAHYASGALVGKRWILTSAGEFYNVRESIKLFRVRLGSVDCKSGGTLLPLKGITIHPAYVNRKPDFDIALLIIAEPVEYSNVIRPISISNMKGKVVSAKFMITYWPRIVVNKVVLPDTAKERIKYNSMRVSTQKLIPMDKCKLMMTGFRHTLNDSSLCLKPVVTHHSVCMPDAGAPVIADDGLWGITSGWIPPSCPLAPGPTLCTRTSSFLVRSWLDSQLLDR